MRHGQREEMVSVASTEVWYYLPFVSSAFQTLHNLMRFAFSWLSEFATPDKGGNGKVVALHLSHHEVRLER